MAKSKGYIYFTIRNWAECWAGRNKDEFTSLTENKEHVSNQCLNPQFRECDNKAVQECAGAGQTGHYVYEINSASEKSMHFTVITFMNI